jgi:pyridoxine 4-dehydrogenase
MLPAQLTRRQLLVGAMASAAALSWARPARPAAKPAPAAASAAASGTLRIGGDLEVNRLGFGAMRITGPGIWGPPKDPVEARAVLRRCVELGVNFIDTADAYGPETSERLIAEALYPYPKGLVIATKGGLVRPEAAQWVSDGRPAHLRTACEQSLARLKLERIDLYQLHAIDPKVPLEDSLGELTRLQKEGKIRHIGVSNFKLAELERARRVCTVVSVQNRYNVADRASADVLDFCTRTGIAFTPGAPRARGATAALTGQAQAAFQAAAAAHGATDFQVAIAWLLARSPVMLPIPGTSTIAHLEENVAAAGIRLTPKEIAAIG